MSSKPAPAVTQTTQKVELPAWVDQAGQENYQLSKDVAANPFMAYGGDRVAGLTGAEAAAPGMVAQGQQAAQAGANLGLAAAGQASGFQTNGVARPVAPQNVTPQSWLNQNISRYMDPEIESVINPTLARQREENERQGQGLTDAARAQGVTGSSSRLGVESAVLKGRQAEGLASTEAGLRSAAFERASGRAGQDIQTAMQAALANQQAGLTASGQDITAQSADASARAAAMGLNLQGGQLATTAGQMASDTSGRNALLNAGFGATERGIAQQQLDVPYQNFMAQQGEAEKDLNLRLQALGMTPYGKTTSGTQIAPGPTSNPWMTGIGAAATLLPMMFSDRKVKKNIKKIGKVPGSDLNAYEFQYKKGFMSGDTPKQIGLMADDVKRKVPGAVKKVKVNGETVEAVDYGKALRDPRNDKGKIRGVYRPRVKAFMAA